MERFKLKTLNEGEVKEQYQVTITNKFAALGTSIRHGKILEHKNFSLRESRRL
jgi:hypothetical protein